MMIMNNATLNVLPPFEYPPPPLDALPPSEYPPPPLDALPPSDRPAAL